MHGETREFMAETDRFGLSHKQAARTRFVDCRLMRTQNGLD
jgi:hypothetical protein